jgi:hypothetical protein
MGQMTAQSSFLSLITESPGTVRWGDAMRKTCAMCPTDFEAKRPSAKYCGERCKKRAQRQPGGVKAAKVVECRADKRTGGLPPEVASLDSWLLHLRALLDRSHPSSPVPDPPAAAPAHDAAAHPPRHASWLPRLRGFHIDPLTA